MNPGEGFEPESGVEGGGGLGEACRRLDPFRLLRSGGFSICGIWDSL